uniref:Uncharacterized protein n=1 Tax=Sphaerodactylus townsendi TaxID=933632 RepID=A0ACB8ECZ3_9SAUR
MMSQAQAQLQMPAWSARKGGVPENRGSRTFPRLSAGPLRSPSQTSACFTCLCTFNLAQFVPRALNLNLFLKQKQLFFCFNTSRRPPSPNSILVMTLIVKQERRIIIIIIVIIIYSVNKLKWLPWGETTRGFQFEAGEGRSQIGKGREQGALAVSFLFLFFS